MAATSQVFGGGTADFILDPSNGAKPLPNTPYTVLDGVTLAPATGLLDATGAAVTQLTSDADGRFAGSASLEGVEFYLETKGANGVTYRFGPLVSTSAVSDAAALAPQIGQMATDVAASAASARAAQAAAELAAANTAGIDGGSAAGGGTSQNYDGGTP